MALYDQGGGCPCGLYKICQCGAYNVAKEPVGKVDINKDVLDEKKEEKYFNKPVVQRFEKTPEGYDISIHSYEKITQIDPLPPVSRNIQYKYSEDRILADLKKYLDSTYSEHYSATGSDEELQCFDAWISFGDATRTFINTALKYLWRYGKKDGNNKKDLMKTLHYVILALHNDHYKDK